MSTDAKLPFSLESLCKSYGSNQALRNVTLAMEPGEVFGLLGPNGAGKTSIISILTTLEKPTSGYARIFGQDVTEPDRQRKQLLGIVPQEIVSHGFFSVEEILKFHSGFYGISENSSHINFLLDRLGLEAHRKKKVRQLSGGMKRRLLIAKALVHSPRLLLLDEPTAGVDIELRNSLWEFVRELNKGGMSVLLTTHYLEEAESLCNRVGIINHGEILKVGDTKELVQSLTTREVTIVLAPGNYQIKHAGLKSHDGNEYHFRIPNHTHLGDLLKEASIPPAALVDVHIKEGNLEDAFLNMVWEK